MITIKETKADFKELHDLLSESYYNFHNISKKEFDLQHGKIWDDMRAELEKASDYIPPLPPEPERDLAAEIDELRARIAQLRMR